MPYHLTGARLGIYNVKDYGAVGDGSADDTDKIQAAYTAAGSDSAVYWPTGTYKVTSQINIRNHDVRTTFGGNVQINHVPTAAGTLFDIATSSPASSQLNRPTFDGTCTIYSTDTTYSKIAFKLSNVSRPLFLGHMRICGPTKAGSTYKGSSGGAGGSVGIYTLGRESFDLGAIAIEAQVCLRFGANPDGSTYNVDGVIARGTFLNAGSVAPSTLEHSCILVDNDVRVSIINLTGPMAFLGGAHSFYWKPTDLTSASTMVRLSEFNTESGTTATNFNIHIEIPDSSTQDLGLLVLENCILESPVNGIYTKNVQNVSLKNVVAQQTTGQTVLRVEGASSPGVQRVSWDGLIMNATAPQSMIELPYDMQLSYASQTAFGDSRHWPSSAVFIRGYGTTTQRPQFRHGAISDWSKCGALADQDTTSGTASGATTNAAGYAVGTTTINLASAGTGTLVTGDVITFAGDANEYVVATGDADVSNGGSFTIYAPGLIQPLPASAKAITILSKTLINFPINANLQKNMIAILDLVITSANPAGTVMESATYVIAPNASGSNGITIMPNKTANMVAGGPADGQAGLVCSAANTADLYLVNRLGEACRYLAHARFVKSANN